MWECGAIRRAIMTCIGCPLEKNDARESAVGQGKEKCAKVARKQRVFVSREWHKVPSKSKSITEGGVTNAPMISLCRR